MENLSSLKNINLKNKRVFLRADLNVPLEDKKILEDYRIKAILPTIDYIQKNGGKVILATHIGRPNAKSETNFFDENLSTKIISSYLNKNKYKTDYVIDIKKAIEKSYQDFDKILLIENLRFFNGEKETSNTFAELLSQLSDIYVNDAFGVLHRNDTSVTLLTQQFPKENRSFGLLAEKEVNVLSKLKENPKQPFVIVLGGSKVIDKISMLNQFLMQPKENMAREIIIGGAIANTFLKARNIDVGLSKVEDENVKIAKEFLELAKKSNINISLPIDVRVTSKSLTEPAEICNLDSVPSNKMIVDIGPKTEKLFSEKIQSAKTIFANGTMGIYEKPEYANGSRKILNAIAKSNAYSVIGGGDATAAALKFKLDKKFNFLSTGGGATLKFLSSKNPFKDMPGLRNMIK